MQRINVRANVGDISHAGLVGDVELSRGLETIARRAAEEWSTHAHTGWVPYAVRTLVEESVSHPVERNAVINRARDLHKKGGQIKSEHGRPASNGHEDRAVDSSALRQAAYADRRKTLIAKAEIARAAERQARLDRQRQALERQRAAEAAQRAAEEAEQRAAEAAQRAAAVEAERKRISEEAEADRQRAARKTEELRHAAQEAEERRLRWLNRPAPPPDPQPFGVSHEGAEHLCAAWMRHLGVLDAEVTRVAGDGGIDVVSEHYIAQVKNYAGSVAVASVRELFGVAAADGKRALLFTSGTITVEGLAFAERTGIALLRYNAVEGKITGLNQTGSVCVEHSIPEAF